MKSEGFSQFDSNFKDPKGVNIEILNVFRVD